MAAESETSTSGLALSEVNINWDRLDKTKFHVIGAILFTAQMGSLHPIAVIKTRMQVAEGSLSRLHGFQFLKNVMINDGVKGIFRGFGTSAVGSLPGRVLALTSLEMSKEIFLEHTKNVKMPEATRLGLANGVAGMVSNVVSCAYFVPLDVVCQRLMVQGMPGVSIYNGPYDVMRGVFKTEGVRGLYRGLTLTMLTQSPANALWWGAYGSAQHLIWRTLGYDHKSETKPSLLEVVGVQAAAGTVAGACSSVITTPIDTIKTRLQVMDNFGEGRPSMRKTVSLLLEEDGWAGFYRGFGPRFLNMSLWGTSMIVTYEFISYPDLSLHRSLFPSLYFYLLSIVF